MTKDELIQAGAIHVVGYDRNVVQIVVDLTKVHNDGRPINERRVEEIVSTFDLKFAQPLLLKYNNDRLECIRGSHTYEAMRKLGMTEHFAVVVPD